MIAQYFHRNVSIVHLKRFFSCSSSNMGVPEVDKQNRSEICLSIQTAENNETRSQNNQIATSINNNKDQTKSFENAGKR